MKKIKNSCLLLCLLTVPLALQAGDEDLCNALQGTPAALNRIADVLAKPREKTWQEHLQKIAIDGAYKGVETVITAGVILVTGAIIRKLIYDFVKNEDLQTCAQATKAGLKLCEHHNREIIALITKKNLEGLTEAEQAKLAHHQAQQLALHNGLDHNTKEVTKILNKKLEHSGFLLNNIVKPVMSFIPG